MAVPWGPSPGVPPGPAAPCTPHPPTKESTWCLILLGSSSLLTEWASCPGIATVAPTASDSGLYRDRHIPHCSIPGVWVLGQG